MSTRFSSQTAINSSTNRIGLPPTIVRATKNHCANVKNESTLYLIYTTRVNAAWFHCFEKKQDNKVCEWVHLLELRHE